MRERSFNSDLGDEKFGVRGSLSISLLNSFCLTDRFLVHLSVNKFLCPFLRRDGEGVLKKSELSLDVFMLQLIFSILRQEIPVSKKILVKSTLSWLEFFVKCVDVIVSQYSYTI